VKPRHAATPLALLALSLEARAVAVHNNRDHPSGAFDSPLALGQSNRSERGNRVALAGSDRITYAFAAGCS
jgi:hypothetical protein